MKAICAWCEAEGKPSQLGEREPLGDHATTHGMCWSHTVQLLSKTHDPVRFLVIVAPKAPELFARISEQLVDDPRVHVLIDRRRGERRKHAMAHQPERRAEQRRRATDYSNSLRYHPVIIVPADETSDLTDSAPLEMTDAAPMETVDSRSMEMDSPPVEMDSASIEPIEMAGSAHVEMAEPTRDDPAVAMSREWNVPTMSHDQGDTMSSHDQGPSRTESAEGSTVQRQRADEWIRQGTELFHRVAEEAETLKHKLRASEERSDQLGQTVTDLEREITKLRAELSDASRERAELADAVHKCLTEVSGLTNDILLKIRRA